MSGDHLTEENFMLKLDARHVEKVVDALLHVKFFCEHRGVFIFDDVAALKPPREIHRHEPSGQVTRHAKRSTDGPEDRFADRPGLGAKLSEPATYAVAVMPFLCFDLMDVSLFRRVF